jgi:hypothetical protein
MEFQPGPSLYRRLNAVLRSEERVKLVE